MKPPPPGWPRISSAVFYDDAARAIDWLCAAFGFEVQLRVDGADGHVVHSQLTFGDGLIMVASLGGHRDCADPMPSASPLGLNGNTTQSLCVYVDDVDALCERARDAGARIAEPPTTTDYGDEYWADRNCRIVDPEGHQWWFVQRVRGPGA